ncbi:MAG: type II CRISPR RNA-guided endonuclease Cas9 [bacterium]
MKKILGLDLGTNSIGWAVVNEAETPEERASIIKLGVRVNPLTADEKKFFSTGKGISVNAARTLKHGQRLNLFRYKLRRKILIESLIENNIITNKTLLAEVGNNTTYETYKIRAKSASEMISLEEFARVLLMINKKRGYKSSRKTKSSETETGQIIDGKDIAVHLQVNNVTPGEYAYSLLLKSEKISHLDFYRSDLQSEFDKIWCFQQLFYPEILTTELKQELENKNSKQTWVICKDPFNIVGIKREKKGNDLKIENYKFRVEGLTRQLDLEQLAIVLQEINSQITNSSGYLGEISDKSKILFINKQTIGQYLYNQITTNPNYSTKNQIFYRQDYESEFNTIWDCQAKFHTQLTSELKNEIKDIIIFYQRKLKSQKGLVSFCEFESQTKEFEIDGKIKKRTVGSKVCPKSSPIFQEFKIWQILNNIEVSGKVIEGSNNELDLFDENRNTKFKYGKRLLTEDEKNTLYREISIKESITDKEALKLLFINHKNLKLNYNKIDGNRTQATLFDAYNKIIYRSGHGEHDFKKLESSKIIKIVEEVFSALDFNINILNFNPCLLGKELEKQESYQLWHLLYSYEGDNSISGNEKLINLIQNKWGFDKEYATILANINLQDDYGSLSAKAMKKILPHLINGKQYDEACLSAGYNHSARSLTKEQIDNKILVDKLDLLQKNSLRNPVVEKILNQMINLVNELIATYGRPDEIRVELARELKKSAKEREQATSDISIQTKAHENIKKILEEEFGLKHISKNDIIRYRLYEELASNGYKTLYSNIQIKKSEIFSNNYDIEHIIPKALIFDDSFSNKTLEISSINKEKGKMTALDYVAYKYGEEGLEQYKNRIQDLSKSKHISLAKYNKLLKKGCDIGEGFINRELRDTQYIAIKAREILESVSKHVVATTGSITDRLRNDWGLVDVMKELNFPKYDALGLTEIIETRDGKRIKKIKDWTKRNDHRHHAMDALTVAYTKQAYIQYLNNLSARYKEEATSKNEVSQKSILGIENKHLIRDDKKLKFIAPTDNFRAEAKYHLEDILISIKAKNKVVTSNINITKKSNENNRVKQLTPRGQLHEESIYKTIKRPIVQLDKVNNKFDIDKISTVTSSLYRQLLLNRLNENNNDPKKAFGGKNSLDKKPIYINGKDGETMPIEVKTITLENIFTKRVIISEKINIDNVIDNNIRKILSNRLKEFKGNRKDAFSNLDTNPIWLNKEKNISIKRVQVKAKVSNADPIHFKCNNLGEFILDKNNSKIPTDYIVTGNNHHAAIFRDDKGNLQEHMVSFMEATQSALLGFPIVDINYNNELGWEFLFTLKQNEYFVFPRYKTTENEAGETEDILIFDPNDIDLLDPNNYSIISPNLFRVQKISSKYYNFRHHLETTVDNEDLILKNITWKRIRSLNELNSVIKVRINHIGQIVSTGEY